MDRVMMVQRIIAQDDEGVRLFQLEGLLPPGKELKPLYNALAKFRPKLHLFGLEVAVSTTYSAYRLMPFPQWQARSSGRDWNNSL